MAVDGTLVEEGDSTGAFAVTKNNFFNDAKQATMIKSGHRPVERNDGRHATIEDPYLSGPVFSEDGPPQVPRSVTEDYEDEEPPPALLPRFQQQQPLVLPPHTEGFTNSSIDQLLGTIPRNGNAAEQERNVHMRSLPNAATKRDEAPKENGSSSSALAYLLRYENMIQQQEAEDAATLNHLQPCLERLEEVIYGDSHQQQVRTKDPKAAVWQRKLLFSDLWLALERLEVAESLAGAEKDLLTTDRQLMMVLRVILQQQHEATKTSKVHNSDSKVEITWAELVQCYKTCVAGVQTLQHLPSPSLARDRSKNRTLAMISLFDVDSTQSMDKFTTHPTTTTTNISVKQSIVCGNDNDNTRSTTQSGKREQQQQHRSNMMSHGAVFLLVALAASFGVWAQPYLLDNAPRALGAPTPTVSPAISPSETWPEPSPVVVAETTTVVPSRQAPPPATAPFAPAALPKVNTKSIQSVAAAPESAASFESLSSANHQEFVPKHVQEQPAIPTTVVGAIVAGPVAAVLAQAWQAGTMVSVASMGPAVVFGAGLATLASVAIRSVRALFWQLLLRRQEK